MKGSDGMVLRMEKTSIHDGDGLRTVVFLKGCPLCCKWCSTPESQAMEAENGYGTRMTVAEVVREISKDEIFYFHSGGGVTISGGEVLLQPDFCAALLKECKYRGIHTAAETSGYGAYENIEKILPYLDAVYIDIKHMEADVHKAYTKVSNKQILENIVRLSQSEYNGEIHLRVPLIPGINMTDYNMLETAGFCAEIKKITDLELLPYHRLGIDTYRKLDRTYELAHIKPPKLEEAARYAEKIRAQYPNINLKIGGVKG